MRKLGEEQHQEAEEPDSSDYPTHATTATRHGYLKWDSSSNVTGNLLEMKVLSSTPDLLNQKSMGMGLAHCVFTSPM